MASLELAVAATNLLSCATNLDGQASKEGFHKEREVDVAGFLCKLAAAATHIPTSQ